MTRNLPKVKEIVSGTVVAGVELGEEPSLEFRLCPCHFVAAGTRWLQDPWVPNSESIASHAVLCALTAGRPTVLMEGPGTVLGSPSEEWGRTQSQGSLLSCVVTPELVAPSAQDLALPGQALCWGGQRQCGGLERCVAWGPEG